MVSAEEDLAKSSKALKTEKQALTDDKGALEARQLKWSEAEAVLESTHRLEEEITTLRADFDFAEKSRLEEATQGRQL